MTEVNQVGMFCRNDVITLDNFEENVYLMKIGMPLTEKEQFQIIINNADKELRDLIIKEKISNFTELSAKVREMAKERNSCDRIIKICAKKREFEEDPKQYIEEIYKLLTDRGGSEGVIIELLSNNLWPGKEMWRRRLRMCESIEALKNETVEIMREVRELKSLICNNCGQSGHKAVRCKGKQK